MKPTIGRIVHYWPGSPDEPEPKKKGQPYPAIVTHVHSDDCVNLTVFNDNSYPIGSGMSYPFARSSVCIWNGVGKPDGLNVWTWPAREPVQITQTDRDLARLNSQHMKMG